MMKGYGGQHMGNLDILKAHKRQTVWRLEEHSDIPQSYTIVDIELETGIIVVQGEGRKLFAGRPTQFYKSLASIPKEDREEWRRERFDYEYSRKFM